MENSVIPKKTKYNKYLDPLYLIRGLGVVFNNVGIFGFIAIIIAYLIIQSDKQHKDEIINTWLLLKGSNIPSMIIIGVLVFLLWAQRFHYHRIIYIQKERIDVLGKKKSSEYAEKLKRKLASSKDKKE